ncbi:MAG: TIM barrel protein [Geobacter sp.]|nr:TIM barrel protein [Geobacter sp.]
MNNPIHANIHFHALAEHLPFAVANNINPEIFFSGEALDALVPEELAATAASLHSSGLNSSIHATFMDLNPGSTERLIREATMHRFNQVLDAAEVIKPRVIVFHPGYDRWRYGERQDAWLGHALAAFRHVLERTEQIGCIVAVENIFEEEPSTLKALIEAADSPRLRHCFDVGHWNMFKKVGMEEWFAELGQYIAEAHVHDNFGLKDDHLPIGEGAIDFDLFFSLMKRYAPDAVLTIEAHSKDRVERGVANIRKFLNT